MERRRQPLAEISRGNIAPDKTQKQSKKHKPPPTLGAPIQIGKENVRAGVDAEILAKHGVKGKPLRKNLKWGPNSNYKISEEDKQKAEIWAREGIEKRFGLSGREIDVLDQKMREEEVNRHLVGTHLRTDPDWMHLVGIHPFPFVKSSEIKEEDLFSMSPQVKEPQNVKYSIQEETFYDESFYDDCLEMINSPQLFVERRPF